MKKCFLLLENYCEKIERNCIDIDISMFEGDVDKRKMCV